MAVKQLEEASGRQGADVRLISEIIGKVHLKTKELGLDPNDTTGKELYHALINRIEKDEKHLVEQIGGHPGDSSEKLMPLMKKAWEEVDVPKTAWVLKQSVAKEMLRSLPPQNIMAALGYKSIDSMLKRENLYEVYGALRFAESPDWLNKFNRLYKTLKPSDFENRKIEIVVMPMDRWGDIAAHFIHKKKHNITHLKEMGVILMLPITGHLRGITIFSLPLLFHYLNEIRLYSAFFKLQQVKPDFGKIVVNTLIADPGEAAVMAGTKIHWRVIQRYLGRLENEVHPQLFEPHVQPEDLHWRKAEELLAKVDPDLAFWLDLDFVAVMHGKRPIALNMLDVAANYVNQTEYTDRIHYHFTDSLWNEIFVRYMGEANLEEQVLKQLNNNMIAPEKLKI